MSLDKHYCYGKASSLIEAVERNIGFDEESGLIKDGSPERVFLDTFENSSLGIAYVLLGREEEARRILKGIKTYIGVDTETGLFYNKKGLSEDESKKILPGEKTLYLSNQALVSTLSFILGEEGLTRRLGERFERDIGRYSFEVEGKNYQIYRHGKNQEHFYPFNNLLVAVNNVAINQRDEAEGLVRDIKEICLDRDIGLLRANPKGSVYFTLNNSLLATYYAITGRDDKSHKIINVLEDRVGFDKRTGLAFEGFNPRKRIENVLTYVNTQLAISYLSLTGMW